MKFLRKALAVFLCCVAVSSLFSLTALAKDSGKWVGAWSTSPVEAVVERNGVKLSDFLMNSTVRILVKPTLSGTKVRFKLSNAFGNTQIKINGINVAKSASDDSSTIIPETLVTLKVKGETSFSIPAGEYVYTDAVAFDVTALETVAVTYYVSSYQQMRTEGFVGAKAFITSGNKLTSAEFSGSSPVSNEISGLSYNTIPYLINMDVWATNATSIVFIGDSTLANDVPALVAQKLVGSGVTDIGVLQQAISGNRLLYDGVGLLGNIYGPALIDRFKEDALNQKGVSKIFVKVGVNDILHPRTSSMQGSAPEASVDDIINGYKSLITEAHKKGIKIYFFEITPWKGYTRELLTSGVDLTWDEETQALCDAVNKWIRTNKEADGYVDLSGLADKNDKYKMDDLYTDDYMHFKEAGQILVADAIPDDFLGSFKTSLTSLNTLLASPDNSTGGSTVTPAPTEKTPETVTSSSQSTDAPSASDTSEPSSEAATNTGILIDNGNNTGSGLSSMQVISGENNTTEASSDTGKIIFTVIAALSLLMFAALMAVALVFLLKKRKENKF